MKKQIMTFAFLLTAVVFVTACSLPDSITARKSKNGSFTADTAIQTGYMEQSDIQSAVDAEDSDDSEETEHSAVYMVIKNDSFNYQITLMNLADASQICYEYTDGTEFFDKYGNDALSEEFSEGRLAVVKRLNSNDTLGAIAFTDQTWSYEDVRNYTIQKEKNRISIADTVYRCAEEMKVFSEGEETDLYAIGENDILNIYGIDRTIYSVVVKSGHGTLELTNTELFEGGWMNLGTQVYAVVTKDMSMEIPEGIYKFAVANDGYGDDGEIRIRRDQTTTIDLNDYKGEGPKMCRLLFNVSVEHAVIRIDGKKIDYSKPLEVRYGIHTLGVRAKGYDQWSRQLVINSPTANIDVLLTEDTGTSGNNTDASGDNDSNDSSNSNNNNSNNNNQNTDSSSQRAGSLAGSLAGSHSGGNSSDSSDTGTASSGNNNSSSALANTALSSSLASIITGGDSTDYLDTLADLVKSLDKLNSASSNNGD